jgi:predicted PurR-regulated permease PerM
MQSGVERVRVVNLHNLILWGLGVYLLIRFVDAVAITLLFFVLALVLAIALDGPICWLQRRHLSRKFSVATFAFLLLTTIVLGLFFGAPALEKQATYTLTNTPKYIRDLQARAERATARFPVAHDAVRRFDTQRRLSEIGQSSLLRLGKLSLDLLSGVVALVLLVAVTFYAVAEPEPLVRGALRALPKPYRGTGIRIYRRVMAQLQAWARATFWLMLIIGVLSGLGLWAIGVPSPLVFGIIAGLGEAVPVVGPIVTCVPPLLVMLASDPIRALWVVLLFVAIQQIEGNILVPRIMATAMKLHPVPVLFCVVIMGSLTGPIGLLLAIPLLAIAKIVYEETYLRHVAGRPIRQKGSRAVNEPAR